MAQPAPDPRFQPDNPARAYLDALGAGSRRTMTQALGRMVGILQDEDEADPEAYNWTTGPLNYLTVTEVEGQRSLRRGPAA